MDDEWMRYTGEVIRDVTFDEYWRVHSEEWYEWVGDGMVKLAYIDLAHHDLVAYLSTMLRAYVEYRPVAKVRQAKMVMKYDYKGVTKVRVPDLHVTRLEHKDRLFDDHLLGACDIAIEVVMPVSAQRDYYDVFFEYRAIGVQEYWIFCPTRQRVEFNRLTAPDEYTLVQPDGDGVYRTPLLPEFELHVPTLWRDPLPSIMDIIHLYRDRFGED